MPLVTIDLVKNVFTQKEKRAMIQRVSEAMIAIEGEGMRDLTWVRINEIEEGDMAIGGQLLTADSVRLCAADKSNT